MLAGAIQPYIFCLLCGCHELTCPCLSHEHLAAVMRLPRQGHSHARTIQSRHAVDTQAVGTHSGFQALVYPHSNATGCLTSAAGSIPLNHLSTPASPWCLLARDDGVAHTVAAAAAAGVAGCRCPMNNPPVWALSTNQVQRLDTFNTSCLCRMSRNGDEPLTVP
jgi:hypothetical protein